MVSLQRIIVAAPRVQRALALETHLELVKKISASVVELGGVRSDRHERCQDEKPKDVGDHVTTPAALAHVHARESRRRL